MEGRKLRTLLRTREITLILLGIICLSVALPAYAQANDQTGASQTWSLQGKMTAPSNQPEQAISGGDATLFSDGFETYTVGTFPATGGWVLVYNGMGTQYQQIVTSAQGKVFSGQKSLQLWGQSWWSAAVWRRIQTTARVIGYEEAILIDQRNLNPSGTQFEHTGFYNKDIQPWGRRWAEVRFYHTDMTIRSEGNPGRILGTWTPGAWYKVKVILDRTARKYGVWINDALKGSGLTLESQDTDQINGIGLTSDHPGVKVYHDNIRTFEAIPAAVDIRNIGSGENVYSNLLVVARVTGTFSNVYYRIDLTGSKYLMYRVGTTDRFEATWNTVAYTAGSHTLYVEAFDSLGNLVGRASVNVTVVRSYRYELYYEIDYMLGHYPPTSVLTYMQNYWAGHAVSVSFLRDDIVTDPTPTDGKITTSDFWAIEKTYNDVWRYDDRSFGGSSKKYNLREKWMLYGTWADDSSTGGYCYVTKSGGDALAGNYIFIADSMIDRWEVTYGIPCEGGEETVVCHEAGHSIGIERLSTMGSEVYDSDYYSVMSTMRMENAKHMVPYWYYSKEYWTTNNLGYYGIL